jgi:hypothetical protein
MTTEDVVFSATKAKVAKPGPKLGAARSLDFSDTRHHIHVPIVATAAANHHNAPAWAEDGNRKYPGTQSRTNSPGTTTRRNPDRVLEVCAENDAIIS